MIPFKIAMASAAALSTVVVGGGITYAMVGAPEAAPTPTVAKPALPAVPAAPALPDCASGASSKLPMNAPAAPSAVRHAAGTAARPGAVTDKTDQVKSAAANAAGQAASTAQNANAASAADAVGAAKDTASGKAAGVAGAAKSAVGSAAKSAPKGLPAGAPNCLPSAPVGAPAQPAVPAAPAIPKPDLSCNTVPAAVQMHSPAERVITGSTGLRFVSAHARTLKVQGQKACAMVQSFKAMGGQWLTVERLQGVANTDQARQVLKLTQAQPVDVAGTTFWESPLAAVQGGGIAWSPAPGTFVFVTGSPVYQTQLQQMAVQLSQLG
jgi:hypothetical protein